jgi:hypothetical protein
MGGLLAIGGMVAADGSLAGVVGAEPAAGALSGAGKGEFATLAGVVAATCGTDLRLPL